MTAEEEFQRGIRYLQRGRSDLAAIRFERAMAGGVNVYKRLLTEPLPEKPRYGQTRPDPSSYRAQELFKALVDAKPKDFEKGKNFIPQATERQFVEDQRPVVEITAQGAPAFDVPPEGGAAAAPAAAVTFRHPWMIVITNNYDTSDPPVFEDATAVIYDPSVVYQGFTNFTSVHTVSGIATVWVPVAGNFLYLAGTTTTSGGVVSVTGITLSMAASLPARTTFSAGLQTAFTYAIGRFFTNADGSFFAEQRVHTNITMLDLCIANQAAKYPFQT